VSVHGRRSAAPPVPRALPDLLSSGSLAVELPVSAVCGAIASGVGLITAADRKREADWLRTPSGLGPLVVAVVADAVAHSAGADVAGTYQTVFEPLGAACGVSYLMLLLLSSQAVDPKTLAPRGTVVAAESAADARARARGPYTRVLRTAASAVDWSNAGFSGAGWDASKEESPKLPVTSVAAVVAVGTLVLETLAHAPTPLEGLLPRVFTAAAAIALVGAASDLDAAKDNAAATVAARK